MKLNEYGIFENGKNGHLLEALVRLQRLFIPLDLRAPKSSWRHSRSDFSTGGFNLWALARSVYEKKKRPNGQVGPFSFHLVHLLSFL